jgi:NADPH:quinone reductase-like Zn-dependent oxidoreductase
VLVSIEYSGVNFIDTYMRSGVKLIRYTFKYNMACTQCIEH